MTMATRRDFRCCPGNSLCIANPLATSSLYPKKKARERRITKASLGTFTRKVIFQKGETSDPVWNPSNKVYINEKN